MQWILVFCLSISVFYVASALPSTSFSRINFHEEAQNENFTSDELEILGPILDNLQTQYDQVLYRANENENSKIDESDSHLKDLLLTLQQHFADNNDILDAPFQYTVNLPTLADLKKSFTQETPLSDEMRDMEKILEENIYEARHTIQALIDRSNETEAMLISINKIKILKFIYKVLGNIFSIAIRVSRAAYCTYSYIPIINSTLTEGRANIGSCYINARNSIVQLRAEVQAAINNIRDNIVEVATIYRKISNRESLLGKLFTLVMNISKITNNIRESRAIADKTITDVKAEVPTIRDTTTDCFGFAIPSFANQLNETVVGLTTCINFVDDSTQGPEPEPESSEDSSEEIDTNFSQRLF